MTEEETQAMIKELDLDGWDAHNSGSLDKRAQLVEEIFRLRHILKAAGVPMWIIDANPEDHKAGVKNLRDGLKRNTDTWR